MSTEILSIPSDNALAAAAGDAAMVALLRGKPADEAIPTAVWWLVAEALRTTVAARRSLTLPARADDEDFTVLLVEALLLTDAALEELLDGGEVQPDAVEPVSAITTGSRGELHRGTLTLARLLVSHRPTSPQRLGGALASHAAALHAQITQRGAGYPGTGRSRSITGRSAASISSAARS
jgi:hypothetical protein